MPLAALLFFLLLTTVGCSHKTPAGQFPALVDDFVYTTLAFSPVTASGQGLHTYKGNNLDAAIDNITPLEIRQQRQYYVETHQKLIGFDKSALSAEDQADYDIVDTQIGLALFDIDVAQTWRRSPQTYVELIGSALFNPLVLEYAPKPDRFRHIIARMQKLPFFLDTADKNLRETPSIWAQVAKEENDGNIDLIDKTLRAAVPDEEKADFDAAAGTAIGALRHFNARLENLARQGGADWQLGPEHYPLKFKLALGTNRTPDQVLADAEARLKAVRAEMLELAKPIHRAAFPSHGAEPEGQTIREVLDRIAEKHSTPASYLDDARKDLADARAFAAAKNLLTLPRSSNLEVIPTPEFEQGIYGVGGFNPAPVLEPQLGAFFWITPVPKDWPQKRVESKLREYNFFNLQLLVIHEAMPGHYVQFEFANAIEPRGRRILRALYGSDPYIEGWAQYITQVMLDQGYLDNAPELRLTLLKQELRVDANAIIDIRMQTNRMTDQEAMDLMENTTFQEHEEAVAKLQRVKLSSTQLPTYFVGWRDWLRVRDAVGGSLHDFHDRALKEGAVPLPVLARLLTGKDLK
ncbi:MAG TPA: DUF885 domain-containing protein [Bryobacteraceae bacterium]|nr:DUF885 domain-containing protein [Bryobacteraceae bacterium]